MKEAIPLGFGTLLAALVAWLSIRATRKAIEDQPRQSLDGLREMGGSEPTVPQEFTILVEEVKASLGSRAYFLRAVSKRARRILGSRRPDMRDDRLPPALGKLLGAHRPAGSAEPPPVLKRRERVSPRELEAIIEELEEL